MCCEIGEDGDESGEEKYCEIGELSGDERNDESDGEIGEVSGDESNEEIGGDIGEASEYGSEINYCRVLACTFSHSLTLN